MSYPSGLGVFGLDLPWLIPWFRTRRIKQAKAGLQEAKTVVSNTENVLKPFLGSKEYVPERIKRPLLAQVTELHERTLPPIVKRVLRARDSTMREQLESLVESATQLRRMVTNQNDQYVQRAIAEHSKLLVEELRLDAAQQEATVRDDERNLVIAAAGSGKTRTLIARVRYLLERGIVPNATLAVTFTNKATEEMEDRLKRMNVLVASRENEGVTVSTLHALGMRIVQITSSGPTSIADDRWTVSLIAAALRDARIGQDPQLARLYLNAVLHFHRNQDELAPALIGELTYRTLRGEHVRSVGERIIADFLFTHDVPYKYEAKASWAQVGPGRTAYHPDFVLLKTGTCIEYWGINRKGEVPGWWATSSAEYKRGMAWKRDLFRRQGETLIEFFDYEPTEGTLEEALQARLSSAGVVLRSMTIYELEKVLRDSKYIGSVIEQLLVQFIANARSLRLTPDEIHRRLRSATPRVHHFGLLGIAVLKRYETDLSGEGRVDFSEMLHRAADILEKGRNPLTKFEHILVDELQDTSAAMARFLKALLAVNHAHLFAVGDDWQAIFGFAGGDVDHIVNFESHFGPASTSVLNINYRSPAVVVEAGAALIAHNPQQIPKQIVVSNQDHGEAFIHEVPDDDSQIVGATIRLIQEERQRARSDDILVLSRTNHLLEKVLEACPRNRIPLANPDRNIPGVRILSAHEAKGLEANVVIVINASDHPFGFPSRVENPDVLEPVRMSPGNDQAEERRLFYVAITRAMKRLHLIARQGLPSPYIAEIEGTPSPSQAANPSSLRAGVRFSDTFYVEQVYRLSNRQAKAGIRQSGLLATSTVRFSFTSWAHIHLQEGGTYGLSGVIRDRPFRDQQQVRLDAGTRVERWASPEQSSHTGGARQLRPRPPPSYQPCLDARETRGVSLLHVMKS